jgi:hypothetical protein
MAGNFYSGRPISRHLVSQVDRITIGQCVPGQIIVGTIAGQTTVNIVDKWYGVAPRRLFQCPHCGHLRRDLFILNDAIACRSCHHLQYPGQSKRRDLGRIVSWLASIAEK